MKQKKLSNSYLSVFCIELAMLLQAGVTLSECILILRDDEPNQDEKVVMQSLLYSLDNGEPLSEALRVSGYFPDYAVNMVEIGEKSNRLTETLKALSEHYDRQSRLDASIRNAVLYPAILLVTMITVVLILIIRVLPSFHDIFNQLGNQLPTLAERLMQFSEWLGNASTMIAIIVAVIFVAAIVAWNIPAVRQALANAIKNIFGSHKILKSISASRFTSAMVLAIASGLDIHKMADMLRTGNTLAESTSQSGIPSAKNSRIFSLGCSSGMMDSAMAEIANRSERIAHEEISRIVEIFEPVLVIAASVIVGVILLLVMLPIMSIMAAIG